ncbi:copper homeostasis protein CutC [Nocardioides mangrovicus]|uniref:Copper homeostasis protein CutC n=1 Tax=Nocardioides mangrovicus TaxID=2478913 RepID=A0A3L8NX94_9ACTN|nr:copper homeostasis protein CutC [Nocardioides mangrovicus]
MATTPAEVSAAVRETDLPVRVLLRGEDVTTLARLGTTAATLGAAGYSLGWLDRDLEIDVHRTGSLLALLPHLPWAFDRCFDDALRTDHAWHAAASLPRLDGVASGGSPQGLGVGGDDLVARAGVDPGVARLLLACGGLEPALVPWLVRAGVRQFGVGSRARAGDSWTRGYVDVDRVRSWRLLLDDALDRALGVPVE